MTPTFVQLFSFPAFWPSHQFSVSRMFPCNVICCVSYLIYLHQHHMYNTRKCKYVLRLSNKYGQRCKNRLHMHFFLRGSSETHLSCTCCVSTFCNSPNTTVTSESSSRNLLRLFKYVSYNKSITKTRKHHSTCLTDE